MLVAHKEDVLKTIGGRNESSSDHKGCDKERQTEERPDKGRPLSEIPSVGDWVEQVEVVWACQADGWREAGKKKKFGVETTRQKTVGKAQKKMDRWSGRSARKEKNGCGGEKDLWRPRWLEWRCEMFAGWQMKIYQEDGEISADVV